MSNEESNQNNIIISDQSATKDSLGFEPYVIAMADFLTNPDTQPPLTISIEGEWGSGKSFFMEKLETHIKVKSEELKKEKLNKVKRASWQFWKLKCSQKTQTVWFNAWRHEKAESLWATFAISFLEEISRNRDCRDFIHNLYSSLLLFIKRLDFKEKPMKSLQTLFSGIVICSIIVGFIYVAFFKVGFAGISNWSEQVVEIIEKSKGADKEEPKNEQKPSSKNAENLPLTLSLLFGGAAGSLAGVGKLLAKLKELIGDPKMDLTQYLESPDYKSQVAFVEKFHADFRKIVEAYVGKDEKVYVFIDDLDRCELGKAADLLQALNMMISNEPQIIFILGMDREKVAAGITYKQKDVLPYLASIAGRNQDPKKEIDTISKQLNYGFSYLEKFVQLSFTLPKPSENSLDGFFEDLSSSHKEKVTSEKSFFWTSTVLFINQKFDDVKSKIKKSKKADTKFDTESEVKENSKPNHLELALFPIVKKHLEKDEKEDLIKMVAPFFDNNPRRLKQYINGFRLTRYIYYYAIGVKWEEKKQIITQQQLGKFVAITLQYPRLLNELKKDNMLLNQLEQCAIDKFNQSNSFNNSQNTELTVNNQGDANYGDASYWVNTYQKLAELLYYGVKTDPDNYSLKNEGIKKLLEVSPKLELPSKYFKLREFLEEKKWQDADVETLILMRNVAEREGYEMNGKAYFRTIEDFPLKDRYIIDQLWVKYSAGHFGFSVQQRIYQEFGGTIINDDEEIRNKFLNHVGWRQENDLTFTADAYETAPKGYLPKKVYWYISIRELTFENQDRDSLL
ncbi:MAG: hypothetical protein RLZZ507_2033 [Cyanobacteriota bacterium]|jgi:hypothetical protein